MQTQVGYSGTPIAPTRGGETAQSNGFVAAGVEKCWSRSDSRDMDDVFIVISQGHDGEPIARTFYAADLDDARQTHHENYADELLVAVHR